MFPKKFTPGIDCMFVCQKISLKWWPNYSKFDEDPVFWEVDFVFFILLFRAVNTPGKFSNFEKLTLSITAKPNMTRIWYRRFKIHFKAKRQIIPHSFRCACNLCCGRELGIASIYPYIKNITIRWTLGCPSQTCFFKNQWVQPIPMVFGVGWKDPKRIFDLDKF